MPEPTLTIANRVIGPDYPPYIVAELSANHNGDIDRALAIIEAAKKAGADAIKLQTYTADTITIDSDGPGFRIEDGPWAGRTLYDLYQEASTPWEWHEALFAKARKLDITVFSSPFDSTAVDFLESLGVEAYKIASFEVVDLPLIEKAAATGKPLIISTGMANREEIADAVSAAREAGCRELALLHCVSAYPATPEAYRLKTLGSLAEHFETVVGLSDHTLGTEVAIASVALGATIIEKHFTLSRNDGGPDAAFSLEPEELHNLCEATRIAWSALGLASYERADDEAANVIYRRSLYAVADINQGDTLNADNVRSIRPGFGMAPKELPRVIGRKAKTQIVRGTPLSWDLID